MTTRLSPAEERLLARFAVLLDAAAPGRVRALRVFGSRARGASHEGSDLDVAVEPVAAADMGALRRQAIDAAWEAAAELSLEALALAPVVLPMDGRGLASAVAREGRLLRPDGSAA